MKTLSKVCFGLPLLFVFGATHAEWKTPTAAEMLSTCSQSQDNTEGAKAHFALCAMPIKGFIDGYKRGVARGLRSGFIDDVKNRATIQGAADAQNRIGALGPRARCVPAVATTEQVEQVFVNYVKAHPGFSGNPYPEVLSDAIEEYFCPP